MKIGLVRTYFCNECKRHAYPDDIVVYRAEDDAIYANNQDDAIYVTYKCACGLNWHEVLHVIDSNDELFPQYNITMRGGLS